MDNKIICFQQDTKERKRYFKAASFAHPAKMVLGLQIYLIEHYTKPGDTILDPMAGSGTILIACTLGRNVVLVELEEKFVKMQQENLDKIKSLGPMLGFTMGEAKILQGDARQLGGLLVDKCIFSPPYAEMNQKSGINWDMVHKSHWKKDDFNYSNNSNNIGNLPYGKISAVISSPPYEDSPVSAGNVGREIEKRWGKGKSLSSGRKYADAVITSPPYEEAQTGGGIAQKGYQGPKHSPTDLIGKRSYMPAQHEQSDGQIGNLKSENYLEAMLSVYRQCHRVLKDRGLFCLVVKNFIRDKKIVQLDLDTIKLCENAGFVLKERLKRKLTQQSFWRIIYQKKFPDAPKIEFEDVLIFEKTR